MSEKFAKLLAAAIFTLVLSVSATAQKDLKVKDPERPKTSPAAQVLNLSGQIAVIVVGQTAKAAWKTTKFAAGDVAKPMARQILLKAAPKLTVFALKFSGKAMKKGMPVAKKLAITYLKTRLSI